MNFFDVGKVIRAIVDAIPRQQLPSGFVTKVWPIQAISGNETYPFCVYRRISGRCNNLSKDGFGDGSATIMLSVITDSYDVSIINTLASAFVNYDQYSYPQNSPVNMIDQIQFVDSYEDFNQDGYIQTIRLEITFK